MDFIYGPLLLAAAGGMVFIGRPRYGKTQRLLERWAVGQVYVLTCLIGIVLGTSLIIANLPKMF